MRKYLLPVFMLTCLLVSTASNIFLVKKNKQIIELCDIALAQKDTTIYLSFKYGWGKAEQLRHKSTSLSKNDLFLTDYIEFKSIVGDNVNLPEFDGWDTQN